MKSEYKTRFDILFGENKIPEEVRGFWYSRLENSPEDMCENILNLFEQLPGEMGWFTEVQKKKESAIANNDKEGLENIIAEEESYLLPLLNK